MINPFTFVSELFTAKVDVCWESSKELDLLVSFLLLLLLLKLNILKRILQNLTLYSTDVDEQDGTTRTPDRDRGQE